MKIKLLQLFLILEFSQCGFAQIDSAWNNRYRQISSELKVLEDSVPALNEKVTTSVSGVTLNEFLRAIAKSAGVNLSVDPKLSFQIVSNFNDVKVSDVLLYLSQQYRLDISNIGNIIIITQLEPYSTPPISKIQFDSITGNLSIEVEEEQLSSLVKEITETTRRNVIIAPGLSEQKIKAFIRNTPFASAMDKLAYSNNLILRISDDGFYILEKQLQEKSESSGAKTDPATQNRRQEKEGTFKLSSKLLSPDSLWLYADKAPIEEIIKDISTRAGNSYIMASIPKGDLSLQLNGAKYQDILQSVLSGSDCVFKKQGKIYIIGNKNMPNLMSQRIIQLQYRAVDSVQFLLPKDLIQETEIRVFREQNSLMLSGPEEKIVNAERFIQQIDRLVPVISIEVLIIDYNTTLTVTSGIEAGIGTSEAAPTSGEVFPSVDINLNSQSINDLISRFNGFGWAKIGKVTPRFYASLKAMETQGILNVRSTPILSTLNGHRTEMSIGNTEYYLEEHTNIIGTQNPQTETSQIYKPVNAELSVVITPIISGDDQITLNIEVNQSDFTERISSTAPPGLEKRTFKSQIRVKNEEMILLGGLEENRSNKTSRGIPFLSRIPILKWIFSSRTEGKSKSKLNIFIKPTIIS